MMKLEDTHFFDVFGVRVDLTEIARLHEQDSAAGVRRTIAHELTGSFSRYVKGRWWTLWSPREERFSKATLVIDMNGPYWERMEAYPGDLSHADFVGFEVRGCGVEST